MMIVVIWEDPSSGEELSFVLLSRPAFAGVTKWGRLLKTPGNFYSGLELLLGESRETQRVSMCAANPTIVVTKNGEISPPAVGLAMYYARQ